MKITIISLDNWGFNQYIVNQLELEGHEVKHINFNLLIYKYPSHLHRIYNFFLKNLFKKNIKTIFYGKKILSVLKKNQEVQDIILTIKGDFIDPYYIKKIKNYTKKSIAFFNDNITRCPKIKNTISSFDAVYSFEREDCKNYNLNFITNYIYEESFIKNQNYKFQVFNISSVDKRISSFLKIAKSLKEIGIKYEILILDKKGNFNSDLIKVIKKPLTLEEVNNHIKNSKVLLDINRKGQKGLTFRVFESIGARKKLITTNTDIKSYDFYNPKNIWVIENDDYSIDKSFFETEYINIPEEIYNKYTISGWLKLIIFNN